MLGDIAEQKFNDDLLLGKKDRETAERRYPTILHILDNPSLRSYFEKFDPPANHAKQSSRRAGCLAIFLAALALMAASAEHPLRQILEKLPSEYESLRAWPAIIIAVVSGLAGIASVVIGSVGVLFAGKKKEWLYRRFMTERVRQFHFQMFVCRLPEIRASLKDERAQEAFILEREEWLEGLKATFEGKVASEFAKTVSEEASTDFWLHDRPKETGEFRESADLDPLFRAYRELRILHQIGYANFKLRDDHKILSEAPRRQATELSTIAFTCIVLICALHIIVLATAFFEPGWSFIGVAIIWLAIVALAVRAVEQGLQPEREIERYQQYSSAVKAVLERFDDARSQAEKVRIMEEMERLSFDEMRNFLLTNNRSQFVM
jgi:hypothetical protein